MSTPAHSAVLISALMDDPMFRDALVAIANAEADRLLSDMRRYVKEGNALLAALSEAKASEWERLLVVFKRHAQKYQAGE